GSVSHAKQRPLFSERVWQPADRPRLFLDLLLRRNLSSGCCLHPEKEAPTRSFTNFPNCWPVRQQPKTKYAGCANDLSPLIPSTPSRRLSRLRSCVGGSRRRRTPRLGSG